MSKQITNKKLYTNQSGMASILITMVMMIIISLIVLGFAQISQREQRETVDRQLSTQAFYAAESGVNDALHAIDKGYLTENSFNTVNGKTTCNTQSSSDPSNLLPNSGYVLNASAGIQYTCLLIQPNPSSLQFNSIGFDQPTIVPIQTVNSSGTATAPSYINLSWQNNSGNATNFSCYTSFTTTVVWTASGCGASVLRLDIVPVTALDGSSSRANLQSQTMTTFFRPVSSGGTASVTYSTSTSPNGQVIPVNCSTGNYACNVQISGLNASLYYWRLQAIYSNQTVCISANATCSSSTLNFTDAQVLIDSTGKAGDVLRRIQVRAPINTIINSGTPFVIQSTNSICKRFTTTGSGDNSPALSLPALSGVNTNSCFGN